MKGGEDTDHIKLYLLNRDNSAEPCNQCTAKHLRDTSYGKLIQREVLQPGLVQFETKDDGLNNQRCLYLDKTFSSNPDHNMANLANLEYMRKDILVKEQELVAINDAQKVTAQDMKFIHAMILQSPTNMYDQIQYTLNEMADNETRVI